MILSSTYHHERNDERGNRDQSKSGRFAVKQISLNECSYASDQLSALV